MDAAARMSTEARRESGGRGLGESFRWVVLVVVVLLLTEDEADVDVGDDLMARARSERESASASGGWVLGCRLFDILRSARACRARERTGARAD